MKKLLLLFISSLLVISTVHAQTYKISSYDNQKITTCKGMFVSSGFYGSPVTGATGYTWDEDYTVTFCSGGGPIQINFNYAQFAAGDYLTIYDGPSISSPVLISATGNMIPAHKAYKSSGSCLTFHFVSDYWSNGGRGWQAYIGCTPAGCNGNTAASDICANAPTICNLNGYCGSTSGWYTADNVYNLENITLPGCATGSWTIQNNSWLGFIASSPTATFSIKAGNCSDGTRGMQAVVLGTTNCTDFYLKSDCVYDDKIFTLNASGLTVGTKYYVMIDGSFGNDCDYTVTASSGVKTVVLTGPSSSICEGQSATLTASSGGTAYKWLPGGQTTPSITVYPTTSTTYTCEVTGACDQVQKPTIVVNVKPKPVVTATPTSQTFCSGGTTSIALNSPLTPTTYAWTVTKTGGTTTGSSTPGTGTPISQTLNATGTTAGIVTYNITPTSGNCAGDAIAVPVTVNPVPTVTATPTSQTFCSGGTTGIALTSNIAGTTFSWTVQSATGVSGASAGSGTSITQTLTATGTVAGTVTYEITPTSASCPGAKKTVTITVNPRPIITPTVTAQNLCSGGTTSIGLQSDISGATYTWTVAVTGGVTGAANGSGSNIVQTLTASGTTTGTVEYTITATTPAPASCSNSAVTKVLVTVYPIPTVSLSTPAAICLGQSTSITATVAPLGGTFSWTPGNLTINPITVSPTSTTSYNCQYTVNGCSNSASRNVTVNPLPGLSINTSSSTICAGKTTILTASSPDAGGTYSWAPGGATTNAITVSPASNTTYTVTYTLATTCSQKATSAITVKTVPTVTVTPTSASICSGVSTTLNTSANPAGGTYLWAPGGATTPSITVSPASTTTYTLTYTGVNGCALSNSSAAITVTPLDDAGFSYAKSTYCGNASDTIAIITGKPGGIFTATPIGSPGLVFLNTTTGAIRPSTSDLNTYSVKYTTNGTCPNSKTVSLTIASNPKADFGFDFSTYCQYAGTVSPKFVGTSSAGTFSATPPGLVFVSTNTGVIDLNTTTPGSYLVRNIIAKNGTCNADTSDFVPITITAAPILVPSSKTQSICSPSATNITLTGGTTYDWTAISPAAITGASNATADATGVIAQTLTTSDVVPGIVHYIVTPKGGTGCVGKSDSIHVTVNPVPTASATPVTPTVCSGLVTDIKLTSNIPTATFTWTVTSSAGVIGASAGTGSIIAQALTDTTASPGTVVYHITPAAFGTCNGTPIDVSVTVNPNPITVITIPPADQIICSGETTNIHLTSSTGSTNFTWTVNQSGVSGGSNGSGTDINQLLTVLGSTPGKAVYSITGSSNGCSGSAAVDSVTVNPIPTLVVTPLKQEICSGSQTNIALVSNLPGVTFSWTITPRSITGGANGSTAVGNIIQTLTNPGSLQDSVTYHIVATVGGCSSNMAALVDSVEASIIVNPKPVAIATSPVSICSGDTTNIAITGNVSGATYSYKAATATVIGSGDGSGDLIQQGLSVNTTADSVIYTIIPTSIQGCIGNPTKVIVHVNPRSTISFTSASNSICSGTAISVDLTSSVAGTMLTWTPRPSLVIGTNSGTGPSPAHIGDVLSVTTDTAVTVIYDVTGLSAGGCMNLPMAALLKITVNPLPKIIPAVKTKTICDGDSINIALTSNVTGTTFTWQVIQTNAKGAFADTNATSIRQELELISNSIGTVKYIINSNSPSGCHAGTAEEVLVTINPSDDPAFHYSTLKYCQTETDPIAIITGGSTGVFTSSPIGLILSDSLTGKVDLSASKPGDYFVNFVTNGACSQQTYQEVIVNPVPVANTDSLSIGDSNCGTLTGTITGITTASGTAPFKYEWKNSSGVIVSDSLKLDSVPPGFYTLKITDANGCYTTVGNGNGLNIKFLQTVTAAFTSDVTSGESPLTAQFTNLSTSTGVINYLWNFDNGNTSTVKHPSMTFDAVKTYNVCLYVDDGGKGCRDTVCAPIEVFTRPDISIVPNVFTPNGDGINDILMITAKGLGSVYAQIYNRWGQKEYEWNTLNGGWDGFTASGVPATEGTYYIILQAVGADKNKTAFPPIKQSFTLLR